ncbi:glycosyltransferase family 4 protein [Calothrix sp. UHCC 0171]|uniref:glycosyltransferase family 4 protein n=1 Tax=Calothrix sp. UHCC 0171 TaxID=3110245 RepID=UPI002B219481|nr:glycosyltransferase family 4 protein [Calothrix sp. UHCC 0171]MEA5570393.1 glycosyltransferase family 4 protein [Calothrix sp. UHCC 0171]
MMTKNIISEKMMSKQLKVLHICQSDDPATGGAVRVAVEFTKRLPECGVDAHCLFVYGKPGLFQSELKNRAHYLGIANSNDVWKFGRLLEFIRKFKPDIIHHHDGLLWCHLLTFFHFGAVKISHGHLSATDRSIFSRAIFAQNIQRLSTDLLICVAEHTRSSLVNQGGYQTQRTSVLYNGVNRDRFTPATESQRFTARKQFGIPDNVYVVGFVGRLHCGMKGTDDFLKVISLLPSNYYALVVGTGSDAELLKKLAVNLRISDRVIFTGIVDNTVTAYHALDVLGFTSHYEELSLVIGEAMACKVPIVGFSCTGGVNEILRPDTAYLFPNRDLQAMAKGIIQTIAYPQNWQQRYQNIESLLQQNHDWRNNTRKLVNLYQQTCSHSNFLVKNERATI